MTSDVSDNNIDTNESNADGINTSVAKPLKNDKESLENIELDLLCEGIYRHYGFDFRNYARSSLGRRTKNLMELEGVKSISALQDLVLHNSAVMERFLLNLSINVTSMFRDPNMYAAFREKVVPILRTYPSIRIWHAGCASGEEVYSLAILMEEEHLGDKTKIYATDINEELIKSAKAGIYPLSAMQEFSENYMAAGGKRAFSEYYHAKYDSAIFSPHLRKRIVFSKHNLVSDSSFNEFNVIFCRNVLIYFNETLTTQVHSLLHQSLCRFGILVLGSNETTEFSSIAKDYKAIDESVSIFQRKA
jgi:chemotaxis protein methyltransferase CheR